MHRSTLGSLVVLAAAATGFTFSRDADACGGCFVQQVENTQVSGHRMILSLSPSKTTLWDQITYEGEPESFAWVLPTKGVVEVGLSSDALFENLEARTRVDVLSPVLNCLQAASADSAFGPTSSPEAGEAEVTILAHEVVGPYETVQLSASDPEALAKWLASNGYAVPEDIAPVIAAYVKEKFDFLALKLVPGKDIRSMRPVRVTSPGASPELPLRMVAAGTGAVTPITLWVMGTGRYEPANFHWFVVPAAQVVWDWDTSSSNYSELQQTLFDATKGAGWHVEAAEPTSRVDLEQTIGFLAENQPKESGYADEDGKGAVEAAMEDLKALVGEIDPASLWVTRLHARLVREALGTDLALWASPDQTTVARTIVATKTKGASPCGPTLPAPEGDTASTESGSCGAPAAGPGARPDDDDASDGGGAAEPGEGDPGSKRVHASGGGGCAIATIDRDAAAFGVAVFGAAAALVARRRRRRD